MGTIVRSRAFLFLVLAMVVIAIVAVAFRSTDDEREPPLVAMAEASTHLARTEEDIAFSGEASLGEIAAYSWDFGDGNIAQGRSVTHMYELGGWYNATLTVTDAEGNNATDEVSVGIQPEDTHNTRDLGRERDVRPFWMHGYGLLGTVGPHVAPPSSQLEYDVVRAFGTFRFYVEVWIYEGEGYTTVLLHEEEHTGTGQDIHFTYSADPGDLPPEAEVNESRIHISAMIDQGRWTSSHITVDVVFPFDELEDGPSGPAGDEHG